MAARRVEGDGVGLAVYERGDPARPTVVLVHGYPDDHRIWEGVAAELAGRFHVVAYDVRGAGASDRPRGREPYVLSRLVSDLRAVADAVRPGEPVHLVGHDWGSIQGWEAVCTAPDRFASYTSVSGPSLDHVGHWMREASPLRTLRQVLSSWYIGFFRLPLLPELAWRSGLGGLLLSLAERHRPSSRHDAVAGLELYRANVRPRLRRPLERRTGVPVQLVIPARDAYVTPEAAETALRWAPGARVRRVRARHWLPATHPALLARLVAEHVEHAVADGRTA
ncbi:alpha/beta fold hydrolase [Planomonospora sp. ID67723]|uniref:alpha/beta fold hydrolase n=1 Tax=Planomonospora sp. ID67723 TaxID=2738134 RepID=UPI0027DB56CB|nr:alpha/beta fold hydrolase [Planomonospora sp. ID67723]